MKAIRTGISAIVAIGAVAMSAPQAAVAASHLVSPGQSIQAAIDAASAGDVVKVEPGDYTETHGGSAAIRITKPLKLIAKSKLPDVKVRILPGAGNLHGILVEPENPGDPDVKGILIKGFTIEGFDKMGIWLRHVNKFKIKGNESVNNLENGIFPTLSANGLVKQNVAYGAVDSGLWVEASENVRVIKNEIYNNPTGLEVTVSKKLYAKGNNLHDNTVGLGLYHPNGASLPPFGNGEDGDWKFIGNQINDNNFPNPVTGGLVGQLPTGIGALVIGVERVTMLKNTITGNGFFGIGVLDWCDFNDCDADPPVADPAPKNNMFVRNVVTDNGLDPDPDPMKPNDYAILASDILAILDADTLHWDDGSTGNCYSDNVTGPKGPQAGFPVPLPGC